MIINQKDFKVKELNYAIRSAKKSDAKDLSLLRLQGRRERRSSTSQVLKK
ncbi:hypothetical protein ACSU64_24520 [Bacillaceae bacterium C204]